MAKVKSRLDQPFPKKHQNKDKLGNQEADQMDGFARRKEKSKEDIRQASFELFSRFGIEKVSIVDIARKSKVSQATIYNNFGSKENLAQEFVMAVVNRLVDRVSGVLTSEKPYHEKMRNFIQFISGIMSQDRLSETDGAVFPASADLLNDPEIKNIRDSAQEKMNDLLLALVQEGKKQGQVNPNLSEEAFSIYFKVFMDIFIDPQLQYRFHHDPRLVKDLASLMIYGISGQRE